MNKVLGAFLLSGLLVVSVACTTPAESKSVAKEEYFHLNRTDIVLNVGGTVIGGKKLHVSPQTNCLYLNDVPIAEQQYNVETGKCEGYYQKYLTEN